MRDILTYLSAATFFVMAAASLYIGFRLGQGAVEGVTKLLATW